MQNTHSIQRAVPRVAIVVPCYNEQDALPITAATLQKKLEDLQLAGLASETSRIYFVDDGSKDNTWNLIQQLVANNALYAGVKLTRNYGHQHALYAGLMHAEGDALISIDADLQDDVNVLDEMLNDYMSGKEIVYAVREDRSTDTRFKRLGAAFHYWISERIGIEAIRNHADYRLMSRHAVSLLSNYKETNLYLRGVVPLLGLPNSKVYFTRAERVAGEPKYNLHKMISLSLKGMTSFSIMPLRFVALMGFAIFLLAMALGIWALYTAVFTPGVLLPGWASTVIPIYLLGGLQLFAIGMLGEYIGKTYIEVKNRPLYLVEKVCEPGGDEHLPRSANDESSR